LNKCYPFIVPVLALALLITLPGPFVVARGPHSEIQQAGDLTCRFVQRGYFGQVADGYIWETTPGNSYNNDNLYTGSIGSGERRSLIRFGLDFLPTGAVVRSALFGLWETSAGSGQTVTLYRVTAAWSEGQPTWNNFAGNYDSSVAWGRFTANGPGVLMADVTGLVAAWAGGSVPNYGLLLKNTSGQALDRYASSDSGQFYKPGLLVCYEVSGPPNARDDAATTDEDTPVDIHVLANDSDPDGDALTVSDYDSASTQGGTVTCTAAGVCTYTPPRDFHGTDTFTYTASDGHGGTDTATVTITVNPVNDPPRAVDDAATTPPDVPVQVNVLANDSDPDGDALTVSAYDPSSTQGGPVSCTAAGVCTYTPPTGFTGTDVFTYTASDGHGGTGTATVTITVNPVNDPPRAVDDAATTPPDVPVQINVLVNDSDPDGDALTVSDYDSSSTQGGPVSCTGAGVCTYTPPTGFTGTDVFTYTASDGHGGTATASVRITVTVVPPTEHLLYMPIVMKAYGLPPGPDLVVERIEVAGSHVLVVIRNQGTLPVPVGNSFWVDLYVDPDPAPTRVNQTWPMLCDLGAAWGVTAPALPLPPGGTLTLTIGDPYYQTDDSNFPAPLPAGTPIYVQVDSANVGTTYGAVLENHEMAGEAYNNVGGPVLSTLNAMEEGTATEAHPPTPSGWLPPRP